MNKLLIILSGILFSSCTSNADIFVYDDICKRIGKELEVTVGFKLIHQTTWSTRYTCLLNHPKFGMPVPIDSKDLYTVLRGIYLYKGLHKK